MADSRWWMVPDPSLILNDVIMTSQLLFKIILNFFLTISWFCWILRINLTIWVHNDIKLRHSVNQVVPTIGDKIVETLYGNRVNRDQRTKESAPLPCPVHSKLGCLLFSIGSSTRRRKIVSQIHWHPNEVFVSFILFETSSFRSGKRMHTLPPT